MGWNEPGGSNKNPWGNKGGDGPPDLDEVVRKLQEKLSGIIGGIGRTNNSGTGRALDPKKGALGIWMVILTLLLVWVASGVYIVEPAERGVVMRFGAYVQVTQPGPHWHLPFPIERFVIVNVDQLSSFRHKAQMLTQDENIVDIELTVQSRVQDPVKFLFQDQTPEKTLQDATETVVRETIGKSQLDFILTEGRSTVAAKIRQGTQALMDQYKTGLLVTSVNMQPAKPPEQVKSAFDDAIKAREDKERTENKAHGYANGIVPVARGDAARVIADASAYRDKVIAEAEGDVSRFLAILKEYEKAPEVTRKRMYLDTMQSVLLSSEKIIIDVKNGSNIMYLPLNNNQVTTVTKASVVPDQDAASSSEPAATARAPVHDNTRERKERP